MRIDLHVHSDASDGTEPPEEVIRRAAGLGLDVVALTDHDTTAGWARARAAAPATVTVVPGMELSCQLEDHSVHLLAYLFDPEHEELSRETSLIRDDRTHRARQMVAKLNALGAPVTWEQVAAFADGAVVGRPHIARAMAQAHVVETPADAFTKEWIDDGGRAYVDRYALPADRAIALVRAAGGVPVLAHPRSPGYEVSDEAIAGLAAAGLAGIEVFHPDHDLCTERPALTALARSLGLITAGGSDYHGSFSDSELGSESTPPEAYERIVAQAAPQAGNPARLREPYALTGLGACACI